MEQGSLSQSQEDEITAVIGRFHAWSNGQEAAESPRVDQPAAALQEITYEEALGVRRINRVPTKLDVPMNALPDFKAEAEMTTGQTAGLQSRMKAAAERMASQRLADRQLQTTALKVRHAGAAGVNTARVKDTGKRPVTAKASASPMVKGELVRPKRKPASAAAMVGATRDKVALNKRKSALTEASKAKSNKQATGTAVKQKVAVKAAVLAKATAALGKLSSAAETGLIRKARVSQKAVAPVESDVTFRSILEKRMAGELNRDKKEVRAPKTNANDLLLRDTRVREIPPSASRYALAEAKSIAMKLRVSAEEHAQIKAGASEAGVTLAAYMRQCTLDVKVLKELLTRTIYDLKAPLPSQAASLSKVELKGMHPGMMGREEPKMEQPGMIARLKKMFVARKTGIGA